MDIVREVGELKSKNREESKLSRGYNKLNTQRENLIKTRQTNYQNSGLGNTFGQSFARERKRNLIYGRDVLRPIIGSGLKKVGGGRGRPKGSYDNRYAKYGGVYGYRKLLAIRNAQVRGQLNRDSQLSPDQQQALAAIQARQQANQTAPENQTIPDTKGRFNFRSVHQEVEDYANEVL